LPQFPQIHHVLVRHEQCAAHAAEGYARAAGKVGVCFATSGPGATNLVTGIANAYLDSSPMVAITGQVARRFIGKDAFQEWILPVLLYRSPNIIIWSVMLRRLLKRLKKLFTSPHRKAGACSHRYPKGCFYRRGRVPCPG